MSCLVSPQLWSESSSLGLCRWTSLGFLVPESGESCSLQFVILPHDFSSSSSIILSFGCLQHATKAQSVSLLSGFRGLWEWDHEDSFLSCHCSASSGYVQIRKFADQEICRRFHGHISECSLSISLLCFTGIPTSSSGNRTRFFRRIWCWRSVSGQLEFGESLLDLLNDIFISRFW